MPRSFEDCRSSEVNKAWTIVENRILKLIEEGDQDEDITFQETTDELLELQTLIEGSRFAEFVRERCRQYLRRYISNVVLPALRKQREECMLREFVRQWGNYKIMVRLFSRFFNYLNPQDRGVSITSIGVIAFREVYKQMKTIVKDLVFAMVRHDREEEHIDRALLKHVVGNLVEIVGMDQMHMYHSDFETPMLEQTAAYYSSWTEKYSFAEFMVKAEEEEERFDNYFQPGSKAKLLEMQQKLLFQYEPLLDSGCHALLRDDKVEDLSRMYRLFCRIPKGLESIAAIFCRHVTEEGTALVKQAEDAASNKKAEKKDTVGVQEQTFIWKVIDLHDRYLHYVSECFVNHFLFHKALKEAFEVFCNKGVAGSTSAELLATFCDNLLKKGGYEKLTDEAIEDTLEKVVRLLAYISDKDLFAEFYRKKLARRLLFDKSANDDHERSILIKLKLQCGVQFTSKMERMVTDLTLAREVQISRQI